MSNLRTASVSETAPLQRLESQSSSSEPSSPSLHLNSSTADIGIILPSSNANLNYKNCHKIDSILNVYATKAQSDSKRQTCLKMENQHGGRRIFVRISMDIAILVLVGLPIFILHLKGEAYKRGFFCEDASLKHPFKKSTIGSLTLYLMGLALPTAIVCQPIMPDGSTCDDDFNIGRYIEKFTCRGLNVTPRMLKEIRLSFPSGHSSFTFFTMVYLAIYLQNRMNWQRCKMCKHLAQFLFLMFAWYTALTRISDYQHHVTDVMAGSIIGILYAIMLTILMC